MRRGGGEVLASRIIYTPHDPKGSADFRGECYASSFAIAAEHLDHFLRDGVAWLFYCVADCECVVGDYGVRDRVFRRN